MSEICHRYYMFQFSLVSEFFCSILVSIIVLFITSFFNFIFLYFNCSLCKLYFLAHLHIPKLRQIEILFLSGFSFIGLILSRNDHHTTLLPKHLSQITLLILKVRNSSSLGKFFIKLIL